MITSLLQLICLRSGSAFVPCYYGVADLRLAGVFRFTPVLRNLGEAEFYFKNLTSSLPFSISTRRNKSPPIRKSTRIERTP